MKILRFILSTALLSMMIIACEKNHKYNISTKAEEPNHSSDALISSSQEYNGGQLKDHLKYPVKISKSLPPGALIQDKAEELSILNSLDASVNYTNGNISSAYSKQNIVKNPYLNSFIWPHVKLNITLDNDIFNNTDRYYTNGVHILYSSPAFAFWSINNFLPVAKRNCIEYNSLGLHHAMYTPLTTKQPPSLKNDRPYSSTLYLEFSRKSDNPIKGLIQEASIDIGVIGKAALGDLLQKGVHAGLPSNDEPLGWDTQIANDIIINYNYELKQRILSKGFFEAFSVNRASIGTLNTSASTGIGIRLNTDYQSLSQLPSTFYELQKKSDIWRCSFESTLTCSAIGYNATLNGGLMNKSSVFVLKPHEIERFLINFEARFEARYRKYGIQIAENYLSKEFKEGKCHFWGSIGLSIGF